MKMDLKILINKNSNLIDWFLFNFDQFFRTSPVFNSLLYFNATCFNDQFIIFLKAIYKMIDEISH